MRRLVLVLGVILAMGASAHAEVFNHPGGVSLDLPDGWTVNQSPDGIQFVPPDAQGEMYFIFVEPGTDLHNPQLLQNLDRQFKGAVPGLQQVGEMEFFDLPSGPGAVATWTGKNPQGVELMVRSFLAVIGQKMANLVAMGATDRVQSREEAIRAIINSYKGAGGGAAPDVARPAGKSNPLGQPGKSAPAADPWVGTFEGDGITMEVRKDGDGYAGALTINGQAFAFKATGGATMYGQFQAGGDTYMFAAKLQGDTLTVQSDGNTKTLKRKGGGNAGNPLGGPKPGPSAGHMPIPTPPGPGNPAPQGNAGNQAGRQTMPAGDAGGTPLVANQRYDAGARVKTASGVSFAVPPGYAGALPKDGSIFVMMAQQQPLRVIMVGTTATVPAPTLQSVVTNYFALLTDPTVLGKGVQIQPAGQPQAQGTIVLQAYQGASEQLGALSGVACAKVSGGPGAIMAFVVGGQGDNGIQDLALQVVGSAQFGSPSDNPQQLYQGLAGTQLIMDGGSYNRTGVHTTLARDSRTIIQLAGNGQFGYQYRSMGTFSVPAGTAAQYDTSEAKQGVWRVEIFACGPVLLLMPNDNSGLMFYQLGVDGGMLTLNGTPAQRKPLG